MPASSSLSVEVWQTILRYSIGIDKFLDPEAFEGVISQHDMRDYAFPRNDEAAYWQAEKVRSTLQLVSKSWAIYLRLFEHRFVRMLDIRHGNVNPLALRGAIRVSFGLYQCRCNQFCNMTMPARLTSFTTFCRQTLEDAESVNMQIADMMDEEHQIREFLSILPKFQNVKTFLGFTCTYSGYLAPFLNKLPEIRQFYGKGYWGMRENDPVKHLMSQNLTTLSLHTRKGGSYNEITFELPSLHYLRLKDDSADFLGEFVLKSVLPILRAVGSKLLTLYLYQQMEHYEAPHELWDLCPRLTTFRTTMMVVFPPPFFHPIQTLIVAHEHQLKGFLPPPEWPNLRLVVIDTNWGWLNSDKKMYSLEAREDVRVEDRSGLTFEEYETKRELGQIPASFTSILER
jgi:hypothetical protein